MKIFSVIHLLLILIFSITLINCSGSKSKYKKDNKRNYKYFKIYADAGDDIIFIKLQDEVGIDPKMERYVIIVNIQNDNPDKYILIGEDDDPTAIRYSWLGLSDEVRNGLINWSGSNKEELY